LSKSSRPTRKPATSPPKRRILISTEGEATETAYFTHLHRLHRERVIIVLDPRHGTPLTLVRHAVDERERCLKAERQSRGAGYNEYWVVIDVDEHPNLAEALELARSNSIAVAVSNPCIELWFVLHSTDQTAFIHRHDAQAASKKLYKFEKRPTTEALDLFVRAFPEAKRRAEKLDALHRNNGSPEGSNPSTSIPQFINSITRRHNTFPS
jgi:hypothetical protein